MLRRAVVVAGRRGPRSASMTAPGRPWTHTQSLAPLTRAFSLDAIAAKTTKDLDRFRAWDNADVFSPKLWFFTKFNMFTVLHTAFPASNAAYDIPEFLAGAKDAMHTVLSTLYSRAFFEAVTTTHANAPTDELAFLHTIMSPECVQIFIDGFTALRANGATGFELTHLDIKGAHLDAVDLADDATSVRLHVLFYTEEHILTTGVVNGEELSEPSVRDDQCTWVFESSLQEPIKWTIVGI
ncbi:hypothetical protein SPRG_03785 [Saprolegnia parasitica CBS 223.65]|uniref:Tim44-like domain-containing protein n=1 Tax=Saprolegnia parasitica (strain CBS 223.65) TaxID=695850 RepID=A0A067CRJ1_SAPPC|nr:hypothetical protein SPRG_03785 [Saprolegnia parasitica CBS 223.65]KDO31865.1 hypothetical protein SPRG_03785 [Saprolegnia parasitica CBS 223.65]|eukprot:XP_012197743.1 hypothetical protein SPRG_03785 [Saprolegnia parasitica CBS 223.65]